MSRQFRAIEISKTDKGQKLDFVTLNETNLMPGDVTVAVEHSTVNYKDGLAVTGKAPIIRQFPLIPGVDFAGTVVESSHRLIKAGDKVVLNGWGVGESHHGGYAGLARVKGDWLVPVPDNMTTAETMAIGTAGYTAMLCVVALERQGVRPEDGDILVTGAAGGVGSIAIAILAKLGYRVTASTGRPEEEAFLRGLGASEIIDRKELSGPVKPLAKTRWAGAPEVPTFAEGGVSDLELLFWHGLWAPKNTPKPIVAKINDAVAKAFDDDWVKKRFGELGHTIPPPGQRTPQALYDHHKAEIDKWWPIMKAAGIKPKGS